MNTNMHTWNYDFLCNVSGVITALSVSTLLFQALGALLAGILGAAGSWLFLQFGKPWLEKIVNKFRKNG